jgi:hypothetical protein
MREFTTPARERTLVTFTLDGDLYHFTPPKFSIIAMGIGDLINAISGTAAGMDEDSPESGASTMAMMRELLDWLGAGLPDDEGQRILDRLKDPDDDLDIDTVLTITLGLMEEAGDRPTQPSSDSSESPPSPTTSTDGRRSTKSQSKSSKRSLSAVSSTSSGTTSPKTRKTPH